ncbi:MAG: clostripain-related cysteine peptidase [Elusimicrobiota bacterium]|nr:clostripain-related cysteine peptidase [Elusimicrobiota bacterium]
MKRAILTLAVLAAMSMGLKAQDVSFDSLMSNLPSPAASPAATAPAPVAAVPQPAPAAGREWLVLVFINGVNDLGILGYANNDINEMEAVGSSDKLAVVVEYGILGIDDIYGRNLQFPRGSKTLHIMRDADTMKITSPVISTTNYADMGSEANLVRFVKRGIRSFPAKKTAVILWNHGSGRLGISYDDVSKNSMEVDKLGAALAQIKKALGGRKIDVFATDACLMQMASVAYEFRDSAEVIVGSEENIPGEGYPYTAILNQLSADTGMGAEALGRVMVDAYGASYGSDATLSAIRTSALPGFVRALNNWVAAVKTDQPAFAAASAAALVNSTSRFSQKESKDLVDYTERVEARLAASQPVKNTGAALRGYISTNLVIRNAAKPANQKVYTQAKGLAIYIPDSQYNSANYEKLAFAGASLWDDFLLDMMRERLK